MTQEDPDEFDTSLAQIPVISAGWRFLKPFYEQGNLGAAWPHADPLLRLCWAQWWLEANRAAAEAEGYDLDDTAEALAARPRQHVLWPDFERVVLRDFREAFPLDPATWGIGAAPRLLAPDVEVLYVHRRMPTTGFWQPGAVAEVAPLVMRLGDAGWRVLNVGYETIPVPGWPPKLRD